MKSQFIIAILLFVCASFFLTDNATGADNDVGFAKIQKPDKAITGASMYVIGVTKSEADFLFVKNYTFTDVNYVSTKTNDAAYIPVVVSVVTKPEKIKSKPNRTFIRYLSDKAVTIHQHDKGNRIRYLWC